jgi:acyl-coenzyme A thioesterase PaaI-like protein
MPTSLSQLMQRAKRERGNVELDVPSDWMQGRSVFGGLQVWVALEAMRTFVPSTALRTLQATFVAPVPEGVVRARAQVLRQGKNATHVEARLVDGSETLAVVIGVFGNARPSKAARLPRWSSVDAAEPLDLPFVPGVFPSFTQHFRARWLRGALPFSSQPTQEQVVEVGMNDEGPTTEGHVVAIADFIPPVALAHLDAAAPGSTLTWMLELLCDDVHHLPLDGWRVDAELIAARDGYTSQSVMVWGPDGTPVALSRQSMLVFG